MTLQYVCATRFLLIQHSIFIIQPTVPSKFELASPLPDLDLWFHRQILKQKVPQRIRILIIVMRHIDQVTRIPYIFQELAFF